MVEINKDDYGMDLEITVTESDGTTVVDLTDSTILFKLARHRATTDKVSSACEIVTATSGICKYTVLEGDTDTAGVYKSKVLVTWTSPSTKVLSGRIETVKIVA